MRKKGEALTSAEELPNVRQQIIEKRRMKDVRLDTDYIKLGDLFNILDGLAEKLQKRLNQSDIEIAKGLWEQPHLAYRNIAQKVLEALKP